MSSTSSELIKVGNIIHSTTSGNTFPQSHLESLFDMLQVFAEPLLSEYRFLRTVDLAARVPL